MQEWNNEPSVAIFYKSQLEKKEKVQFVIHFRLIFQPSPVFPRFVF